METSQPNNLSAYSFETVWAALQETDRIMKDNAKRQEESWKQQEESWKHQEESWKQQEESWKQQEESRKLQEESRKKQEEENAKFYKQLGSLTNLFGEFTEYMVAPALRDKFADFGFDFQKSNRNVSIKDKVNQIFMEVDIILENGDKAMLIEIKTKLTIDKIHYHLERLEKMRSYADLHGDKRRFLGGIAGVVVPDEERSYALNQGLYLIEPAGNTFNITSPKGNPKEW